jgi:DEAD/DEAH box helicase domain-containing protein
MNGIDLDGFLARLNEFDALRTDDTLRTGTVDRIQPNLADEWPAQLDSSVRDALIQAGIHQPYQHQANAIGKSLSGADVVLESPTASGKTLAFTAPMLHSLVRNDGSHAMMIYPMKALAFDQRAQIERLCEPLSIDSWAYDGDTPDDVKKWLRGSPPQILMTNPEYLNMSFLGWKEQWEGFLHDLRYIVIDEMHEYRGFFGSNMALLLRRFFLHLNRIGSAPRVFLSTATCANPKEHAQSLTGRDVEVVPARNVLRPKRHFIFVEPNIPDFRYRDILRLRIEQAALTVLSEGLHALVFCPTKRFLEESFRNCRRAAADRGLDAGKISAFHADLKNDSRQDIQQRIKSGDINVVFTTNALELGLDIGGLDGVILAGFPPSIMSAWQQIGRAGRGWDKDAFVLFYAMNDPIDRFFVGNLDAFLSPNPPKG